MNDRYILKKALPNGTRTIIEKISKTMRQERGCSKYWIFAFVKDGKTLGYDHFAMTEKRLKQWYEPLNNFEVDE